MMMVQETHLCQETLSYAVRSRTLPLQVWIWVGMSSVMTRGVRVPDVNQNVWYRFAGLDVDQADIDELLPTGRDQSHVKPLLARMMTYEKKTKLVLGNVLAD